MSTNLITSPTRLLVAAQNRWREAMGRATTHAERGEGVVNYILVVAAVVVIAGVVFPIIRDLIVDEAETLDVTPLDG